MTLIVYPRIERLPLWRLPAANLEGSHAAPERTLQTSPLATTVRPYAPGDSMNRIHWKSTARHGEIQVKEFDLEQTADVWIFLDLDRRVQAGTRRGVDGRGRHPGGRLDRRPGADREPGRRADRHSATGMAVLPADRGGRQHLKIMQLLAAVDADGAAPLVGGRWSTGLARLRRGMTAVVITPRSTAAGSGRWPACAPAASPASSLSIDAGQRRLDASANRYRAAGHGDADRHESRSADADQRALRHALAEHDLRTYRVVAGTSSEQLAG